ncbi:hypothetical protein [uncultured Polaribacter sp.]|uniref:OB-fold protein n=1 Tax=uncultured Polaribacter sp. TaxID=174711 RepID=UPI00261EEA3F|nr:hypothetical protein [uncultured Polaribacter sp.]
MKTKKIIIGILILGLLGVFVAYKMYHKPHVNVADESADITLTANTILEDFSSDETMANTKYLEKIIQVEGIVSEVKTANEKGIITLKTNDDFASVLCHLSTEATKKIHTVKVGQTLKLKGICTGFLMDVVLIKCEFIN